MRSSPQWPLFCEIKQDMPWTPRYLCCALTTGGLMVSWPNVFPSSGTCLWKKLELLEWTNSVHFKSSKSHTSVPLAVSQRLLVQVTITLLNTEYVSTRVFTATWMYDPICPVLAKIGSHWQGIILTFLCCSWFPETKKAARTISTQMARSNTRFLQRLSASRLGKWTNTVQCAVVGYRQPCDCRPQRADPELACSRALAPKYNSFWRLQDSTAVSCSGPEPLCWEGSMLVNSCFPLWTWIKLIPLPV